MISRQRLIPRQHLQLPNLGMIHFFLYIAIVVIAENNHGVLILCLKLCLCRKIESFSLKEYSFLVIVEAFRVTRVMYVISRFSLCTLVDM